MPITEISVAKYKFSLSLSLSLNCIHYYIPMSRLPELPTHARNKSSISVYHGIYFRNCVAIVLELDDASTKYDRDRSSGVVSRMHRGFPDIPLRDPSRAIRSFLQSIAMLVRTYICNGASALSQ